MSLVKVSHISLSLNVKAVKMYEFIVEEIGDISNSQFFREALENKIKEKGLEEKFKGLGRNL